MCNGFYFQQKLRLDQLGDLHKRCSRKRLLEILAPDTNYCLKMRDVDDEDREREDVFECRTTRFDQRLFPNSDIAPEQQGARKGPVQREGGE